jgi:hypothetical protein
MVGAGRDNAIPGSHLTVLPRPTSACPLRVTEIRISSIGFPNSIIARSAWLSPRARAEP